LTGQTRPPSASPHDTTEYTFEEVLARLELGRMEVESTTGGSRLVLADPEPGVQLRPGRRLQIPALFPEQGPILILVVGGLASEADLRQPVPYWENEAGGGFLLWQALGRAGLLHKKDREFTLGRGGFWDERPPRTLGLAMTFAGVRPNQGPVAFDQVVNPWNHRRLETLLDACHSRSMDRLKVVTLGEAAQFLLCALAYGRPGIPVLSLPEPTQEQLARNLGPDSAAGLWLEWASDLLAVGRS